METTFIDYKSDINITKQMQDKFIESFDFETFDNNFKYNFKIMTKKYGRQFIEFCKVSWIVNDKMDEKDFCEINANMPIGFFNSKIK